VAARITSPEVGEMRATAAATIVHARYRRLSTLTIFLRTSDAAMSATSTTIATRYRISASRDTCQIVL
jgi:hypothetical protein